MILTLPTHFSTIEQMAYWQGTTTRMLMACAMGGVIGLEREWRHKASGLRTNMLICMGAALFTMLSAVVAGEDSPNKAQIASNIVQGIGFLGAGLILHTRSRVLGLTSAATVWVVAGIGMACGAGLYVESAIATAIVYSALQFIGILEASLRWKRFPMVYEVRGTDEARMFEEILLVLDRLHTRLVLLDRDKLGAVERVSFTLVASSTRHRQLLAALKEGSTADAVFSYNDDVEE